MFTHPRTLPLYHTLFTIQHDQFALIGTEHNLIAITGESRNTVNGIKLPLFIASLDVRQLLRFGIIAVESILITLHPEASLIIDIETLDTACNTIFWKDITHITLKRFRHRVIDTVVHTLLQPQLTIKSLHDFIGIVVAHGSSITLIRIERLKAIAIIAAKTISGTKPHITSWVTIHTIYLRIRQTVTGI